MIWVIFRCHKVLRKINKGVRIDYGKSSFETAVFIILRIFGFRFGCSRLVDFDTFFFLLLFNFFVSDLLIDRDNLLILFWPFLFFFFCYLLYYRLSISLGFDAGFGSPHRFGP
jgi:hypothetical protein